LIIVGIVRLAVKLEQVDHMKRPLVIRIDQPIEYRLAVLEPVPL
jgi:hypothetical protein